MVAASVLKKSVPSTSQKSPVPTASNLVTIVSCLIIFASLVLLTDTCIVRDCKEARVDKNVCKNCNQPGHRSKECTEPRSAEGVECRVCSEMGHFSLVQRRIVYTLLY